MTKPNHSYKLIYILIISLCVIVPICAGITIFYAFTTDREPVDSMSAAIPAIDVPLYESVSQTFLDRVSPQKLSDFSASSSGDGTYTYGRGDPFR